MPDINITFKLTDEQVSTIIEALTGMSTNEAAIDAIIPRDSDRDYTPSDPTSNIDSHGIPWHPEHHSSVKKLTTKGYWKRVRGGDRSACSIYEAQYENAPEPQSGIVEGPIPIAQEIDEVLPPVVEPTPQENLEVIEDKILEPLIPVVEELPTPTMLPMPSAPPVEETITYEAVLQAFKDASDRIGSDVVLSKVGAIYAEVGVKNPGDLTTDETLRAGVYERLVAL